MLVYLFELDSVRNSEEEIKIGQRAIYEEIVRNGNKVILSFNQLTDSKAFLSLIKNMNEDSYHIILELFNLGYIKVSLYGEIRTASQYMQNAIKKCLDKKNNAFIFSGIPVKCDDTEHLSLLLKVLENCDLALLKEQWSELVTYEQLPSSEKEKVDYLYRFIQLILQISIHELSSNTAKKTLSMSFTYFIDKIISLNLDSEYQKKIGSKNNEKIWFLFLESTNLLKNIKEKLRNENNIFVNNRSNWHIILKNEEMSDCTAMAEAIVDICYNYTIEDSIDNIAKHYSNEENFFNDFFTRLINYWTQYHNHVHDFHKTDTDIMTKTSIENLHWDTALRLIQINKSIENDFDTYYEKTIINKRKSWNKKLLQNVGLNISTIILYVLIFIIAEMSTNALENYITSISTKIKISILTNNFIFGILNVLIFGVLSSFFYKITKIPDILESFQGIVTTIKDSWRYSKVVHTSYCNINITRQNKEGLKDEDTK